MFRSFFSDMKAKYQILKKIKLKKKKKKIIKKKKKKIIIIIIIKKKKKINDITQLTSGCYTLQREHNLAYTLPRLYKRETSQSQDNIMLARNANHII